MLIASQKCNIRLKEKMMPEKKIVKIFFGKGIFAEMNALRSLSI